MEDEVFKFELGSILKDRLTGLKGVCTARTQWMYGCTRYLITPQKLKDDKPVEGTWIDEPQVVQVSPSFEKKAKPAFGPQKDPKRF